MGPQPLQFEGEEHFAVPAEKLYERLTDVGLLAQCIPDAESAEAIDDRNLRAVVRPGVSFLRGTLKLHVAVDPVDPPRRAEMRVDAQGIGATISMTSRMEIEPHEGGSRLRWQASVEKMSGLVATVSRPLIQAAAQRVIQGMWDGIRQQVEAR